MYTPVNSKRQPKEKQFWADVADHESDENISPETGNALRRIIAQKDIEIVTSRSDIHILRKKNWQRRCRRESPLIIDLGIVARRVLKWKS